MTVLQLNDILRLPLDQWGVAAQRCVLYSSSRSVLTDPDAAKEEMGMKINQTASEVIEELGSDLSAGLSEPQVQQRIERYGYNELQEVQKDSLLKRFLLQFTDPLIVVLILAALICIINLVTDLIYGFVDPRIMAQYTAGKKKKRGPAGEKEGAVHA